MTCPSSEAVSPFNIILVNMFTTNPVVFYNVSEIICFVQQGILQEHPQWGLFGLSGRTTYHLFEGHSFSIVQDRLEDGACNLTNAFAKISHKNHTYIDIHHNTSHTFIKPTWYTSTQRPQAISSQDAVQVHTTRSRLEETFT